MGTGYAFGEQLRGFRTREGLSQQKLANELGVGRNTIGNWESGRTIPDTRENVLRLAEILSLSEADTDSLLYAAHYPREYNSSVQATSSARPAGRAA